MTDQKLIHPAVWKNKNDIYPSKEDAKYALNILVGRCVGMGLKEGDYTTRRLMRKLVKYIQKLEE